MQNKQKVIIVELFVTNIYFIAICMQTTALNKILVYNAKYI